MSVTLFSSPFACPSLSLCPGWLDFNGEILVLSLFKEICVFWFSLSNLLFNNSCEAEDPRAQGLGVFALPYK